MDTICQVEATRAQEIEKDKFMAFLSSLNPLAITGLYIFLIFASGVSVATENLMISNVANLLFLPAIFLLSAGWPAMVYEKISNKLARPIDFPPKRCQYAFYFVLIGIALLSASAIFESRVASTPAYFQVANSTLLFATVFFYLVILARTAAAMGFAENLQPATATRTAVLFLLLFYLPIGIWFLDRHIR